MAPGKSRPMSMPQSDEDRAANQIRWAGWLNSEHVLEGALRRIAALEAENESFKERIEAGSRARAELEAENAELRKPFAAESLQQHMQSAYIACERLGLHGICSEIAGFQRQTNALERENAELRRDRGRLDWLEVNLGEMVEFIEDGVFQDDSPTLREVIDAAMPEQPAAKETP